MVRVLRLLACLLLAAPLAARADGPTLPRSDIGARPMALAGAYTALADDANAIHWNPAGLGWNREYDLRVEFCELYPGASLTSFGIAGPVGRRVGVGLAVTRLNADAWPEGFDRETGTDDLAIGPAIGWRPLRSVGVGLGFKYLDGRIDSVPSRSTAFDGGVLWRPLRFISAGAGFSNFGPARLLPSGPRELPTEFRAGLALRLPLSSGHLLLSSDFATGRYRKPAFSFGVESYSHWGRPTYYSDSLGEHGLSLRVGYSTRGIDDSGPGWSFGAGYVYDLASFLQLGADLLYTFASPRGSSKRGAVYLRLMPDRFGQSRS